MDRRASIVFFRRRHGRQSSLAKGATVGGHCPEADASSQPSGSGIFHFSCTSRNNPRLRIPPKGGDVHTIAFCTRCRGMRVGWNTRYAVHCLWCKEWLTKSSKVLILMILASILTLVFSTPGALVFSDENSGQLVEAAAFQMIPVGTPADPAVKAIEAFLERYKVQEGERGRIAAAIVKSGRKNDVD